MSNSDLIENSIASDVHGAQESSSVLDQPTIHVIGLGVAEHAELQSAALNALQGADVVIGSQRQLATVQQHVKPLSKGAGQVEPIMRELPPLAILRDCLLSYAQRSVVILASGDPLYFGIGRWLIQQFESSQLNFYPGVSSIQMACHRCHLALQDVQVLSLHGRPLERIRSQLARYQTLVVLTDDASRPQQLAKECIAAGFTQSEITVCENLGYATENISRWSVEHLVNEQKVFSDLHVSVIRVQGHSAILPSFPGIADHHFITGEAAGKGMISKREVRLAILSMLQIGDQHQVWDIGAGCGGVTVEAAYWHPTATIHAVECHQQRQQYLQENCLRFGVVSNVVLHSGRAPQQLHTLPQPDRVFIGGSDGELLPILDLVWQQLPVGGILVASAVMNKTRQQLIAFAQCKTETRQAEFDSTVIQVSRRQKTDAGQPTEQLKHKLAIEVIQLIKRAEHIA